MKDPATEHISGLCSLNIKEKVNSAFQVHSASYWFIMSYRAVLQNLSRNTDCVVEE